jgi:threonine/homoserine/homoserine lactone efflux protein
MLLVSVVGIAAYSIVVLQVTAFIAVAGVLAILAWIGWTMATTSPPAPLDIEQKSPETETCLAEGVALNQSCNHATQWSPPVTQPN